MVIKCTSATMWNTIQRIQSTLMWRHARKLFAERTKRWTRRNRPHMVNKQSETLHTSGKNLHKNVNWDRTEQKFVDVTQSFQQIAYLCSNVHILWLLIYANVQRDMTSFMKMKKPHDVCFTSCSHLPKKKKQSTTMNKKKRLEAVKLVNDVYVALILSTYKRINGLLEVTDTASRSHKSSVS